MRHHPHHVGSLDVQISQHHPPHTGGALVAPARHVKTDWRSGNAKPCSTAGWRRLRGPALRQRNASSNSDQGFGGT